MIDVKSQTFISKAFLEIIEHIKAGGNAYHDNCVILDLNESEGTILILQDNDSHWIKPDFVKISFE